MPWSEHVESNSFGLLLIADSGKSYSVFVTMADQGMTVKSGIRWGITFQGPLNSRGFNCMGAIERQIEILKKSMPDVPVVIATWDHSDLPVSNDKYRVLVCPPPPGAGSDPRFRRHQLWSTLCGITYLARHYGTTHVLKVRSDFEMDLAFALRFLRDQNTFRPISNTRIGMLNQPVHWSYINRSIPFHIGDFFFAGTTRDLSRMCAVNLAFGAHTLQEAVECDIILKFLRCEDPGYPLSRSETFNQLAVYGKYNLESNIWKYWLQVYEESMRTFPEKLLLESKWRGSPFFEYACEKIFGGNRDLCSQVIGQFDFTDETTILSQSLHNYLGLLRIKSHPGERRFLDRAQYLLRVAKGNFPETPTRAEIRSILTQASHI